MNLTTHAALVDDPEVDQLRDLIAAGWDQRDASRLLWGDGTGVSTALLIHHAGQQARTYVRTQLTARLPWLRIGGPR